MSEWRQVPAIFVDRDGTRDVGRSWVFGKTPPDKVVKPLSTIDAALPPVISDDFPSLSWVVIYGPSHAFVWEGRPEMLEFEETYRGPRR